MHWKEKTLSNPVGFGAEIDEFELENELVQLEQEAFSKEMAQINLQEFQLMLNQQLLQQNIFCLKRKLKTG